VVSLKEDEVADEEGDMGIAGGGGGWSGGVSVCTVKNARRF